MSARTPSSGRPGGTGRPGNLPPRDSCPHAKLSPRWRNPAVMGDDARAMGFVCHRCHAEFLPYEVRDRRLIRSG